MSEKISNAEVTDSELEILSEVQGNRSSYSEVTDSALEILSEARRIRISYSEGYPAPAPRIAEMIENTMRYVQVYMPNG